ncbi:alpha/beta fold hydrolase [Streptomyces sp. MAI_2237]
MFTLESSDGIRIHVRTWLPDDIPRAVVQIAHGMGEHAGRYESLAKTLTEQGFAVYANDHRGHGLTRHAAPGHLGEDGWNRLVGDLVTLSEHIREVLHPGLPLVLLGHSLGSFASQQYVLRHAHLIDGLVLAGTTAVDRMLAAQSSVSPDVDPLRALNASFEPSRTPFDWLSRDPAAVDAYLADALCGFSLDGQAMGEVAVAAASLADPQGIPHDLPICVLVGDHDPLNAELALSDLLVERYRQAGVRNLTYRIYPGARHELFNETNRDEVAADLLDWMNHALKSPRD